MPLKVEFEADTEFSKLIARRSDVDLTTIALEIARDAYPHLEFGSIFAWISERADELTGPVANAGDDIELLQTFGRSLAETHGIHGNETCYAQADCSYLPRVIETGRGIPISLSVLYMAVAEQLGVDLQGVSAPMHFLTRFESAGGPLFIDAYSHGRILTESECTDWLETLTGLPKDRIKAALGPVGTRTIVIRMLNNLKGLFTQSKEWSNALNVQQRLFALQPAAYAERRDLGLISLHAGRPGQALDLLQACLDTCADDERDMLDRHLLDAEHALAHWN